MYNFAKTGAVGHIFLLPSKKLQSSPIDKLDHSINLSCNALITLLLQKAILLLEGRLLESFFETFSQIVLLAFNFRNA